MGEWAQDAFRRLKEREGEKHAENQRAALERHQILATAPLAWEKILEEIIEEAEDFDEMRPGHLQWDDDRYDQNPSIKVSTDARRLTANFNKDIPQITYRVMQSQGPREKALQVANGEFTFRVSDQEVWIFSKTTSRMTVSDVVTELLDHLV